MSSAIKHLPSELTFRILELSVSTYDLRRSCTPESEYLHLRNTALVCKSWIAPSQILLWRFVNLRRLSQAKRWIDSPAAGQYTTLALSIQGNGGVDDVVLKRVLRKTLGLRTLRLQFFTSISASSLAVPELKGQ